MTDGLQRRAKGRETEQRGIESLELKRSIVTYLKTITNAFGLIGPEFAATKANYESLEEQNKRQKIA